jgi:ribosomal protein S18 acetylase RimI-like enzyme
MYQEIESGMVDWVEREHRITGGVQNEQNPLRCTVCEKNEAQKALLTERGYSKGELGSIFRKRSLDGGSPEGVLPQEYRMQEVRAESAELFSERVSAESEIFGDPFSVAFFRELQKAPIYRQELDLLIMTADGTLAAFCTIWLDGVNQIGFYEPVATVPAYRRCGLGKALMIEGFRRLQKLGATAAYLGNDVDNSAGNYLYDSVGMQVFDQEYSWQMG